MTQIIDRIYTIFLISLVLIYCMVPMVVADQSPTMMTLSQKEAEKRTMPNQSNNNQTVKRQQSKTKKPKLQRFRPSNQIKADVEVSFPTDI